MKTSEGIVGGKKKLRSFKPSTRKTSRLEEETLERMFLRIGFFLILRRLAPKRSENTSEFRREKNLHTAKAIQATDQLTFG